MPRPKRSLEDVAREAAELNRATERNVGFSARNLALASIPFRDPGDVPAFIRSNEHFSLTVQPGYVKIDGKAQSVGYPFGTIPRLLLTWMCSEAVSTGSPDLQLGDNLSEFMRTIGLLKPGTRASGGVQGSIMRLQRQMERLFRAHFTIEAEGDPNSQTNARIELASVFKLFWPRDGEAQKGQRTTLLPARIILSPAFFNEVTNNPVPVDIDALRVLSGSSLRLDLYIWLMYWTSVLKEPITIGWPEMWNQFSSTASDNSARRAQFKTDVRKQLPQVLAVYPQAQVEIVKDGVRICPSPPHVRPVPALRELQPGMPLGPSISTLLQR